MSENGKEVVKVVDLGTIPYKEAWDLQTSLNKVLVHAKRHGSDEYVPHYLLMCEHKPVYTLGKSGKHDHLKLDEDELERAGADFFEINRGGDITFHGPGQLVVYPVLDLDRFFTDVHKYVRLLEETVIRTLATYEVTGIRLPDYTGVWLEGPGGKRKICAIGVHLSRWVTMHGFALNVKTNLDYFQNIVPCGIQDADKSVTSMAQELGIEPELATLKHKIAITFAKLFQCNIEQENIDRLFIYD